MNQLIRYVVIATYVLAMALMQPAHAQAAALTPDEVVATRGGARITVGLIDEEVAKMPDEIRRGYLDDPTRFGRLVDTLLLTSQLAEEAKRRGIQLPQESSLDAELSSLDQLNSLANELLRQQSSSRTEEQLELLARERYRVQKSKYASEEKFTIRLFHIGHAERGPVASRLIAQAARDRVVAGESFVTVTQELGEYQEAAVDESTLTVGQVLAGGPMLIRAMNQIGRRPGISEVLEDEDGFHLVELVRYEAPVSPPYEEIKDRIVQDLRNEAQGNERTTFMRSFSLQEVELNDPVIKALATRYKADSALQP